MVSLHSLFIFSFLLGQQYHTGSTATAASISITPRDGVATCDNFDYDYSTLNVTKEATDSRFVSIGEDGTYGVYPDHIELVIPKPEGEVTPTNDGVNDKIGQTATFNSTFIFQEKGKAYIDAVVPAVPGIIATFKLISETYGQEADLEVAGGDLSSWYVKLTSRPNVIIPPPSEIPTSDGLPYPAGTSAAQCMTYLIEWNQTSLIWGIMEPSNPSRRIGWYGAKDINEGKFPSKPLRLQVDLRDASWNNRLAAYAGGLFDWTGINEGFKMYIHRVKVEC